MRDLPGLHKPGRGNREGMGALDGAVSRRSAPGGSESGLVDSACSPRARPLDGVDTRQIVWLLSAWLCWLVTKSPSDPRQPQTTDDRVAVQPSGMVKD
jgi:hypothetical protein